MGLRLGKHALIAAGVTDPDAKPAAEEIAGYENRLTRLTTTIATGILLLASQAAIWLEIDKLGGKVD